MSRSPEHGIWRAMIQRCTNPKNKDYHHYGGRGIRVCREWLDSFKAFIDDVGERPSRKHSLDRRNNNGSYEPGNVRWATLDEQRNNYRKNAVFIYKGKRFTMKQLSELPRVQRLGISYFAIRNRLRQLSWSVEKSIKTPLLKNQYQTKSGVRISRMTVTTVGAK